MKSTIGKKLISVILVPFLIIFGALLAVITYSVTQYVTNWTELELKGISEINAADLAGRMHSVQISVLSAAEVLDILDTRVLNGREFSESILKSMFENQYIYNAWIACEPDAFDGKDAEHTSDYPGAPSGRFMRSYVLEDGQIVTAPDMDENTLDDPDISPWYVIPRDSDRLYIDIDNSIPNLYDYGLGDEPVYTLSIVAPIHKEGRVIGCVGADVLFDVTTFGIDNSHQAAVAVFYPNGRVFYSQNIEFAEESVDTLHFTDTDKIKEAISGGHSLFLSDEYSIFLDERAFTYFLPVDAGEEGGSSLFLYTAKPVSSVYASLMPIFLLVGGVAATVLLLVLSMFFYLTIKISRPIKSLTLAADAISQGDLETEIASFMEAKDEVGVMSRSLHRMVEQFRVYIIRMEQTQGEMSILSQLDDFAKDENTTEALDSLSATLCGQFGASKTTIAFVDGGRARVFSRFNSKSGYSESFDGEYPDFVFHTQVEALLADKKLLYMNSNAIARSGAGFLDKEMLAACVLPIWVKKSLCGYIIFESDDKTRMMNFGSEAILSHVSRTLADWWMRRKEPEIENIVRKLEPSFAESVHAEPAAFRDNIAAAHDKLPDDSRVSAFSELAELDTVAAITAMGGLSDVYEQSVKLLARLLPQIEERLGRYLVEDINTFAIEIHGLKGSLNNIGAYALGTAASGIERMAKAGDAEGCLTRFPSFMDSLLDFHRKLSDIMKSADQKPSGSVDDLAGALQKAGEAAGNFDALEALDILRPATNCAYDAEIDALIYEIICSLEVFDCEKASKNIQTLKEKII